MKIDQPPTNGVNLWVMASARKCQLAGIPQDQAEREIMAFQGSTRRPLKSSEVTRALEKAYSQPMTPDPGYKPPPKPKWEPARTRRTGYRAISSTFGEADLWEKSPDLVDEGLSQMMILQWLFPDPTALVCVGKSAFEFHTARLHQFKDLSKVQFIVPCYMSKRIGLTQDGKPSMHCLDNCGPRRYCVCDFDDPKSDDHPQIIWQLAKTFDLVMVLTSGGKSLHAWFNVPEDEEEDFWQRAIPLGTDPALMRNRSSFVRIPCGIRDNGRVQYPVYFDQSKLPS